MSAADFLATIGAVSNTEQCNWYAVADSAQHRGLPSAIATGAASRCLLGSSDGSPLAAKSPHLVSLPTPQSNPAPWQWIERHASQSPCVTVLTSPLGFDALFEHLRQFTTIVLPDGDDLFFAFWDPAILGALVGQVDDRTLHVPGPVLHTPQLDALLRPIDHWWYWSRKADVHDAVPAGVHAVSSALQLVLPLRLDQQQVDMLVEASVPDHLLQHIEQNQPELLERLPPPDRYDFVRQQLARGREHGLSGTGDLVNYVCIALEYGEQFDSAASVATALAKVKAGDQSFDAAMDEFDEGELKAGAKAPALL